MSVSYSHPANELPHPARRLPPPAAAATAVPGLRHVDDRVLPGLRRRRTGKTVRVGKRFTPDFVIEDAAGKPVRDEETLERIRKLAIPPAWEEVWISPLPNGHIQATGRDARGRKQYRYHTRWREERDRTKYSRMVAFGNALPALRRRVEADLKVEGLPRRKVLATVVRLLETTFIRVGNEEYARTNKSFGLTTLKDRHVDFSPGEVRFRFRGKSGVSHQVAVHDPRVARIVRRCRDLPGQELFQYLANDGKIQTIDSADVNDYVREIAGRDFTAKDFRTWAGTVLAALAFQALARAAEAEVASQISQAKPSMIPPRRPSAGHGKNAPAAMRSVAAAPTQVGAGKLTGRASGSAPGARTSEGSRNRNGTVRTAARSLVRAPTSRRTQKDAMRAIEQVAAQLGNTPSVCRKCYVHPAVIASYFDGRLVGALSPATALPPRSSNGARKPASGRGRQTRPMVARGLRPEEAAVLKLLAEADGQVQLQGPAQRQIQVARNEGKATLRASPRTHRPRGVARAPS